MIAPFKHSRLGGTILMLAVVALLPWRQTTTYQSIPGGHPEAPTTVFGIWYSTDPTGFHQKRGTEHSLDLRILGLEVSVVLALSAWVAMWERRRLSRSEEP